MKISKFFLLLITFTSITFSQFNKPLLQIGIGIAEPFGDMKGTYYRYITLPTTGFQYIAADTNLFSNNYGAKTGLTFYGLGKINFDKYSLTRGVLGISFSTFNAFEPKKNGNIGKLFQNPNTGQIDTVPVGANFSYTFNTFSFSLGLEVAPLSFTDKVSPYFGARFSLNGFNSKLSYTSNNIDTTVFSADDFRMGVVLDAGIEMKFSKKIGIVLGANYNLGNLLLKSTSSSINDNYEWGKTNASINDEEGQFWSSIYNPVINSINKLYSSKQKNINWASFYLGVNIYFNTGKTTKKAPKK